MVRGEEVDVELEVAAARGVLRRLVEMMADQRNPTLVMALSREIARQVEVIGGLLGRKRDGGEGEAWLMGVVEEVLGEKDEG